MSIYSLERNDVDGAVKEFREAVMSSESAEQLSDKVSVLLQLQDDPDELERRLDDVGREPTIAAALKRLK